MKVLYIGQYTKGTTSRMRSKTIEQIVQADSFKIIDTHLPFFEINPLFRSIGFRYKIGPLISKTNSFILGQLETSRFDLIWIDKGVFITLKTIKLLRSRTNKLVHFTPDMAFYANQSNHFNRSLPYFDFVITTKSKEVEMYESRINGDKLIVTTQGFDREVHKPYHSYEEKDNAVVFIGLAEPSRFKIASYLIENNIKLKLVGKGWNSFVEKYKLNDYLVFHGESLFSEDYSKLISSSKFGLGLLSKNFPELHTTRTFEIPACGTALLTENNIETSNMFNQKEVIFYDDKVDIVKKIEYYLNNEDLLKTIITNGNEKVFLRGYDYQSILQTVLKQIIE